MASNGTKSIEQMVDDARTDSIREKKLDTTHQDTRGFVSASVFCPLTKLMYTCCSDLYDEEKNPQGYINLGTSVNELCEDLIVDRLRQPDMFVAKKELMNYFSYHGNADVLDTFAEFISTNFKSKFPIKADNLVITNGTCSALDVLAHAIGGHGDVVLCFAPFYPRIFNDMHDRAGVVTLPIPIDQTAQDPFRYSVKRLSETYNQLKKEGKNVLALVLLNPSNPLGSVYGAKELLPIFHFCAENKLFVLADEIYGLSIHSPSTQNPNESPKFESIFELYDQLPDPSRIVWMWGLSKDFALPGMRYSVMHITDPNVYWTAREMSIFHCIPPILQTAGANLVRDKKWLTEVYFPTNLARIQDNFTYTREKLTKLNIPSVPAQAGFFAFADFRQFLNPCTFEMEHKLFEYLMSQHHLYINEGRGLFNTEPGWYRIIFTVSFRVLKTALDRLEIALKCWMEEQKQIN